MKLTQEQKEAGKKIVGTISKELAKGIAIGLAKKVLGNLLATSYVKQSLKGKEERHATGSETTLQKDENQASKTDKSISNDGVTAQKGNLNASNTDANAQQGDAKALDTGASACMTKAGATEIAAKGLKLN